MAEKRTRRQVIGATGTVAVLALAGCSGNDGSGTTTGSPEDDGMDNGGMDDDGMETEDGDMESRPTTFTVRIENVSPADFYGMESSTGGQIWITPGAYAVHTGTNPIYGQGESASVGLEALAEAGTPTGFPDEPGLVGELQGMTGGVNVVSAGAYTPENTVTDPNDPMGEVPGAPPIAPGGAFEFDIEAESGEKLSVASMFVPSNDIFFAPGSEGIRLWNDNGEPRSGDVTEMVTLWDAGTEPNGEPGFGPDQAPAQDSPDQGADEGGVVRPLSAVDDGYDYPAASDAIRVTLTPQ